MTYYPGIEQDAQHYIALQERQRKLLEELERNNPSLFKRLMKAGVLAILGAFGASLLDQDPLKGAIAGAGAAIMLPPRKKQTPQQPPFPPYRM